MPPHALLSSQTPPPRVPPQEAYLGLAEKTLAFLGAAVLRYDARYIVKVDDDVYLHNPLYRLPPAVEQWAAAGAGYVGCFKVRRRGVGGGRGSGDHTPRSPALLSPVPRVAPSPRCPTYPTPPPLLRPPPPNLQTGQILKSPQFRWWEPQHVLLGGASYFAHAWGPAYALSGAARGPATSSDRGTVAALGGRSSSGVHAPKGTP